MRQPKKDNKVQERLDEINRRMALFENIVCDDGFDIEKSGLLEYADDVYKCIAAVKRRNRSWYAIKKYVYAAEEALDEWDEAYFYWRQQEKNK